MSLLSVDHVLLPSSSHQDVVSKLRDFQWRPTSISFFLWFQVSFPLPLLPLMLKTRKAGLPHSHCYSVKLCPFSPSKTLCQKAKNCTGLTELLDQIYFREFRSSNSSKLRQIPRHNFLTLSWLPPQSIHSLENTSLPSTRNHSIRIHHSLRNWGVKMLNEIYAGKCKVMQGGNPFLSALGRLLHLRETGKL